MQYVVGILLFSFFLFATTSSTRAEWRTGVFTGKSFTHSSDLNISQSTQGNDLTFSDIHYSDESFNSPIYYGYRLGYFFESRPYLGVELEFFHFKIFSDPQEQVLTSGIQNGSPIHRIQALGEVVQRFSISHGVNFLLLNLVGRYGLFRSLEKPHGRIQWSGRLGIGPTILHPESTIEGVEDEHYEFNSPGLQLAIGSSVSLWSRSSLLVEYKFTYNKVAEAGLAEGTADTSLFTHHLIGGIEVHFGIPKARH
jgi:hypothetical protein